MTTSKSGLLRAWLMILTGAGIILFWIAFFTIGLTPENAPPCYLAFEHAFPPPDRPTTALKPVTPPPPNPRR